MSSSSTSEKSRLAQLAQQLRDDGFDRAHVFEGAVKVRCSQCDALVIQGVACHEPGCPNRRHRKHRDGLGDFSAGEEN